MKLRSVLNEKTKEKVLVYDENNFEEELRSNLETFTKEFNEIINSYFSQKRPNQRLVMSTIEDKSNTLEEARTSMRLSILNKAWRGVVKFKRPSVREIKKEEKNNIIDFLVSNKSKVKFSSLKNDKFETKEIINNAVDKVFNKFVLNRIFETSDKALFYAITDELKKHLSEDILKTKSWKLNTEKKISGMDITFIKGLKRGNLILEPHGPGTFPDYEYTFSKKGEYDGEKDIKKVLDEVGVRGSFNKVFIEMKGDKSSRVVASQTTPKKFFNILGESLTEKIINLKIGGDSLKINREDFKNLTRAANIEYAFTVPVIYVKSATNKLLVFYLEDKNFKSFSLKRAKKSIGVMVNAEGENTKEQKMFSIEFTGKAYEEIFNKNKE
jgi:hypothetical protein